MARKDDLRIMFIVGGLGKGGAEKQFLYMLRALRERNANVQVITLTTGEIYENTLSQQGITPLYAGEKSLDRVKYLIKAIRTFRPHFLQATHFYASFYAGLAGRLTGITSIGALRSDLHLDLEGVGWPGPILLRLPDVMLANSRKARENARQVGFPEKRVHVLHNVIDLNEFDQQYSSAPASLLSPDNFYAVTVARLIPIKRLDRFLRALELARRQVPNLVGVVVGDGPSRSVLQGMAESLGLDPDSPRGGVRFLGERNDIPQILSQSGLVVLTSDREGFPNVVLEGMAASLPILSTPVGETPELISEGVNGFIVPFDDYRVLAERLVALVQSPSLRKKIGYEGRRMVEQQFSYPRIKTNLMDTYHAIAIQVRNRAALSILEASQATKQTPVPPLSESRIR